MHRSRLKNIYIRKKSDKNWENYKKQEIFVLSFLVKLKQNTLKI